MTTFVSKKHLFTFVLCFMTSAYGASPKYARKVCADNIWMHRVYLEATVLNRPDWVMFDAERIDAACEAIPSLNQSQRASLSGWSCGPDTIVRSYNLVTGKKLFVSGADYTDFALSFPKATGSYLSHTHDDVFTYNTRLFKKIENVLGVLHITNVIQYGLSRIGANTGALPRWVVEHMNAYQKNNSATAHLKYAYYGSSEFDDVMKKIKLSLKQRHAVMVMIISSPLQWHYVNIVGYNDVLREVLVLNNDNRVYQWSYENLDALMYTGFNTQHHTINEYFSSSAAALANWFSPVDYYNAIFISPVESMAFNQ